jgi:hypothetical protein
LGCGLIYTDQVVFLEATHTRQSREEGRRWLLGRLGADLKRAYPPAAQFTTKDGGSIVLEALFPSAIVILHEGTGCAV